MPDDKPRPAYRLFPLDAAGRVGGFPEVIDAPSDEQAIAAATTLARDRSVELWMGVRRVAVLNGKERR